MEDVKLSVLIIEDHQATAKFISEVLAIEGFESLIALDGPSGIEKAEEKKPHLILLDIMMPQMGGFEVCRRLKEDPATSGIPVIFLTIRGSEDFKKKGIEAGCTDYIVKPFEIKELIEAVRRCLP